MFKILETKVIDENAKLKELIEGPDIMHWADNLIIQFKIVCNEKNYNLVFMSEAIIIDDWQQAIPGDDDESRKLFENENYSRESLDIVRFCKENAERLVNDWVLERFGLWRVELPVNEIGPS